tara:strand:- start:62 stop:520 length:459 start_codon:yes stop_codon:yes gene_type:complete
VIVEFNGAVLVTNQKIENVLENYKILKEEYLKIEKYCQDELAAEVGDLTWWENFKCDSGCYDWAKVYLCKYSHLITIKDPDFYFSYLYKFYKIGLIDKETLYKYRTVEKYDNHYTKRDIYKTLKTLVQAGTPVYLNPEQADFVNTFYKEKPE